MKFIKIFIAIVLAGLLGFVYLFIPSTLILSGTAIAHQSNNSVIRGFTKLENWGNWMPKKVDGQNSFTLENGIINISATTVASANGEYLRGTHHFPIVFATDAVGNDSTAIKYQLTMDNISLYPFQRIENYFLALRIKKELSALTEQAGKYYTTTKANYGFEITEERVKDSLLVATQKDFTDTPSTAQVYALINEISQYIEKNNGIIQGNPMVNITKLDKIVFTQVGLPIQQRIPTNDKIMLKKMVLGNILKVKVVGDQNEVNKALLATENYIHDKLRTSPAMPFVKYATNRLLVQSSAQWVSFIYYPIY